MENNSHSFGTDVRSLTIGEKTYYIIGTAHVSKKSAELVRNVIETVKPDTVCIELDEQRYEALSQKKKWESLDIKTLIKKKQLATLLINIVLASYQKKLGEKLGVSPGTELLEAANTAKENNIPIELCDRDVRITLRRAWNSMSFFQKMKFILSGFAGIFEKEELTEDKLTELKQKDVLSDLMKELGEHMPVLKRVLLDERDIYLSQKMKSAKGKLIVSVVGAGHVNGIIETLTNNKTVDLDAISIIPHVSKWIKIIGWGIPAIIIASLFYIGFTKGSDVAGDNVLFWILANGIPSAIGAAIALGHPLTILVSFLGAPITSLTPVIGAGYVAAFVQAYYRPPIVKEFQSVTNDVGKFSAWWSNKLLRILLVFILSGLGSAIGTYVGAYQIIKNLF